MALTQMMRQYLETKKKYDDCIVFYRLGDFYEMFFKDAEVASAALGLTLTGRDCGLENRAPMCGVPYHAASGYIKKLVDKGYKVAICEQLTAPQKGKSLVERDVVKVITAGTVNNESFLDESKNNYVAAAFCGEKGSAVSWCDITTGQFYAIETNKCEDIIELIAPAEVIKNTDEHYSYAFTQTGAHDMILKYFKIIDVSVFDFKKDSPITRSSGALLEYLMLTQKKVLANIGKIQVVRNGEFMMLDRAARENLELLYQYRERGNKKGSLLWVLDETKTAMGARELVRWIERPLQKADKIGERLDAVEELTQLSSTNRKDLEHILSKISDIGRLGGKVASGDIMPRDLIGLSKSFNEIGVLKQTLAGLKSAKLRKTADNLKELTHVVGLIEKSIAETPPAILSDGGYIRAGYNEKLDEYRAASGLGRTWITKLEAKERLECQIKELKIGFNRISGYYFEVPLRLSSQMPYRFTRRATTASTERFITAELKEIEDKITGAETKAVELESKLYAQIKNILSENLGDILSNAEAVAVIDVLQSLAAVALSNKWVRPKINTNGRTELKNARHPSIEKLIGASRFIANDFSLGGGGHTTMIITGPNMAGKSTYMRTVALTVLLAHIGSFVPCSLASVALTDRIFTRIGASDSMLTGQSTFMVEMNECSNIIHNATKKSLILLDEVGRGTGTKDGLALASAIISYITSTIGANTIFATHLHELTALCNTNQQIKNYRALTAQVDDQIVFLHKVEPGIEDNSFGIDVAKMAGLPKEIITEARKLYKANKTKSAVTYNEVKNKTSYDNEEKNKNANSNYPQEESTENPLVTKIQNIDINRITPMEALIVLSDLVKEAKK